MSKIHRSVVLFEKLIDGIAKIRCKLPEEKSTVLMQWSMALIEKPTPTPVNAGNPLPQEYLRYKKGAIGAVLGRVFITFTIHEQPFEFALHDRLRFGHC